MQISLRGQTTVFSLFLLFASANLFSNESEEAIEKKTEETVVIGQQRGNFTIITEDAQKLIDMPGALGDPLAAVFSLPGVVAADGDGGEPAVRGSSPNDNLYVVDGLPSGYVFHAFINSVFSEFILQDFELYSAGFGSQYSNVTGAVFDINLRKPKQQDLHTIIDLSLLRSGVFVEGSVTENSAFYLSARKSLIHLVVPEDEEDGVRITEVPQEEDYQFKYAWDMNENNTFTFSANGASDLAEAELTREADFVRSNPDFEGEAKIETKYHGESLHYNFVGDTGQQLTLALGQFDNGVEVRWGDAYFSDVTLKSKTATGRFFKPINSLVNLSIGSQLRKTRYIIEYDQFLFTCTEFDADCSLNRRERIQDKLTIDIKDQSIFINNNSQLSRKLNIDLGVQWQNNDYTDESFVHPRFALNYQINDNWALNSKYGHYNRLPEAEFIFPQIGNPNLKSPTAKHHSLGLSHELGHGWSWDFDLYYKTLDNLTLALGENDIDSDLLYANDVEGKAYGFDLLINKERVDKWYGWLALSYGKSKRTNLRTNQTKNYFLDTPLIFNWVVNYQFNERYDLGWRWHIKSGQAYTPIIGVQENPYFEDSVLPQYGDPFSDRLPTYSRLDIRFKWAFKIAGNDAALIIDVINALNQRNVTERTLDYDKVDSVDDEVKTEDTESPGIIPTIGFRFSF